MKRLIPYLAIGLFLALPHRALAAGLVYPLPNFGGRQTVKGYGTLVDNQFYVGKEAIFPGTRYYGYHAAVDLEARPSDGQPIPFYAATDGVITYSGPVSGYGGLILERLADGSHTGLYGHVRPAVSVGQTVKAGQVLGQLGQPFSGETAGERQHLHFGIYKDTDQYFRGHEPTLSALNARWVDPNDYLAGATAPGAPKATPPPPVAPPPSPAKAAAVRSEFEDLLLSFYPEISDLNQRWGLVS